MGFLQWLKQNARTGANVQVAEWRRAWAAAAWSSGHQDRRVLAEQLDALGLPDEELEIEREMLDALIQLDRLRTAVLSAGLPIVQTGHRVVAGDLCHFSTPVSVADDAAQQSGRLILTNRRAIFIGGARPTTLPWHRVAEVVQSGRDVVLVSNGHETVHRFQCNTYADALCGAFLARQLAGPRSR